ncbi:glycosyltransferase family 117 protein [Mucilaginibacter paludis]|uniref:DUF2723 domain-containing protein n=1 Tax=Mucilaginibacter paludis DSM 18603 TaxID=714943 RepID=H1YCC6_9SPHI|nr:DUF2723 domain-containing protein [Mucilaginibacter paludis]EHQ30117.1 hypothetical protein Mucpa_6059 [Mucilaginibacter paludis DSM 18603]
MQYNRLNNLLGWLCFVIAAVTYTLTLEPSVSFWDCGEFISCAFRLQVSHQPGYPLFAMIEKAFSLLSFGNNAKVPFYTNFGTALTSSATVMFLFWTITAMAKKLMAKTNDVMDQSRTILIMGAGLVGALAFAFSDTFWFSAVETIVWSTSTLCTAVVFWGILKWDAHADEPGADRWIVFIAYVMGLSIGIHLLNLVTIPAIALVYYFRRGKLIDPKNTIIAILTGVGILLFVQFGIIQYTVKFAAYFDLFFVNTLKMGFGTGALAFFIILIGAIVYGIIYTTRHNMPRLNMAFICVAFIYLGYSSFAYIPIRATADPNLNNTDPNNAFALLSYLNRDQYGDRPLIYGQYFDSKQADLSAEEITALKNSGSIVYRKGKTQYEEASRKYSIPYERNTLLPRIYDQEGDHPQFYKDWLHIAEGQNASFVDNIKFLFSWQIYQMYVRYFLWNYVGRYNDMDGQSNIAGIDGNWTSGFFDSSKNLPKSILENKNYAPLYALPFLIGVFGAVYHFRRNRRNALVVTLLFFFTGLAIILYVNQPPLQPRERDYSYVSSFYAFAIWIGLGVIAVADVLRKKLSPQVSGLIAAGACLLAAPVLMAKQEWRGHDRSTKWTPHDMAYNYLISCAPNAILFTYGDNDTYSLWYDQEVEGIRPDVRIVNLSLLGTDWYIRGMKHKMNASEPLPITMPDEKFQLGVRDVIYYNDSKIPGSVELKEVFDFITSDDSRAKVEYQSGETMNYLPTKNFKISINPDDVIKNGVVPADQRDKIAPVMDWKYTSNYVTKDNLAMLDILAHNNWKRPVYFAITVGNENMIGLQPYLYKEGFAYHLMPLKVDTAAKDQDKTNTLVMYHNVMEKFKWGNMKNASYLDHESTNMFYPVILSLFVNLSQNLMAEGHTDLAANTLHKYVDVMPDIYPDITVALRKNYLAQMLYEVNDVAAANKMLNSIDDYVVDQLNYDYRLLEKNSGGINGQEIQYGVSLINSMVNTTKQYHQTALSAKFAAQLKDYESKFAGIIGH